MAMSNAERQRRYRERAYRDPDGHLLTRITLALDTSAAASLKRLTAGYGVTQRELIERLLTDEHRRVMDRLPAERWSEFEDGKLAHGSLAELLLSNADAETLPSNETHPALLCSNDAENQPLPHNTETPDTLPSNEATDQPLQDNATFTLAPAAQTEPLSARDARILALAGLSEKKVAAILNAEGIKCSPRTVGYVRSRRNSKDAGAV